MVAPSGQTVAPGPYTIIAEVTGPNRIDGVGLVLSINGTESLRLVLARLTSSDALWGVPDLEATTVDPPTARLSAEALARLQPGDEATFLLWAWDQLGNQTEWRGESLGEGGSVSFRVIGDSEGSTLSDAGHNPSDVGLEAGTPSSDASVGPAPSPADAG